MNSNPPTPRWGMVIDINRCVGCQTCTIACKHTNDTLPGVQWRQVIDVEMGTFPDVQRQFLVTGCQHCAEPPCVPVCPTGATKQRADGLITMDYDTCIGCSYCAVACPYQARTIVDEASWYFGTETRQERAVAHDDRVGVAQKCTFCIERVDDGLAAGQTPGIDPLATPSCASSCIAQAITFGDFNDPASGVSSLLAENQSFQMHAELGTDPQIKYLYEIPTTPGHETGTDDVDEEALSDPANPMTGQPQTFWDFRAAMNFVMGGMGSGLASVATVSYFLEALDQTAFLVLSGIAGSLMAVGLFFVFLEIKRKLRFLYVLLRPQSSWMTRETYFVALFYPALFADIIWPQAWLHGLIGIAAFGFLVSQGQILFAGKGIPAWRAPLIPWMLVASGIFEGCGLYALAHALAPDLISFGGGLALTGAILGLVCAALWYSYHGHAKQAGIGPLARRELTGITPFLMGVGYTLPIWAFAIDALVTRGSVAAAVLTGVAGLGAVVGGAMWKSVVITRACHQQGFAMPKIPQRGSGRRAAPARLHYMQD